MNKEDKFLNTLADSLLELVSKEDSSWIKDWVSPKYAQINASTLKAYTGKNDLILSTVAIRNALDDVRWLTFKQANKLNLKVKKGSKSLASIIAPIPKDKENQEDNKELINLPSKNLITGKEAEAIVSNSKVKDWDWQRVPLFHASQIEGITPLKELNPELYEFKDLENLEESVKAKYNIIDTILKNWLEKNPNVKFVSGPFNQALYNEVRLSNKFLDIRKGSIILPFKNDFKDSKGYYATLLHELTHATKISPEIKRVVGESEKGYAQEELVAELSKLLIAKTLKLDIGENSSFAYLKSWLKNGDLNKDNFLEALKDSFEAIGHLFKCHPNEKLHFKNFDLPMLTEKDILKIGEEYSDYLKNNSVVKDTELNKESNLHFDSEFLGKFLGVFDKSISNVALGVKEIANHCSSINDPSLNFFTALMYGALDNLSFASNKKIAKDLIGLDNISGNAIKQLNKALNTKMEDLLQALPNKGLELGFKPEELSSKPAELGSKPVELGFKNEFKELKDKSLAELIKEVGIYNVLNNNESKESFLSLLEKISNPKDSEKELFTQYKEHILEILQSDPSKALSFKSFKAQEESKDKTTETTLKAPSKPKNKDLSSEAEKSTNKGSER